MSKKAIPAGVIRMLLARSGGYCQNPSCHGDFFKLLNNGEIANISEAAHIIAQSTKGPRGHDNTPVSERDTFDNIIMLCPTCHSLVDKNPEHYPVSVIRSWKIEHESKIAGVFGAPRRKNFNLIYNRLDFLDNISEQSDTKELQQNVSELVGFIQTFNKGEFYAGEIRRLLAYKRGAYSVSIPFGGSVPQWYIDAKNNERKNYINQLIEYRDRVHDLVLELISYNAD